MGALESQCRALYGIANPSAGITASIDVFASWRQMASAAEVPEPMVAAVGNSLRLDV
jgi:hypothetical protein